MVRIHQGSPLIFNNLEDNFVKLLCPWVTKNRGFTVNQALFSALSRTKSHISFKLVTVMRSAASASVDSYRSGLLKIRLDRIPLVNLRLKKLRVPSCFWKQLIWFVLARSADLRCPFAGRGPCFWLTSRGAELPICD